MTQPTDAKRVALSSQMLPEELRILVQQPTILVYLPVLLDISKLLVLILVLQTLALLVKTGWVLTMRRVLLTLLTLARWVNTNQGLNVTVSFHLLLYSKIKIQLL